MINNISEELNIMDFLLELCAQGKYDEVLSAMIKSDSQHIDAHTDTPPTDAHDNNYHHLHIRKNGKELQLIKQLRDKKTGKFNLDEKNMQIVATLKK